MDFDNSSCRDNIEEMYGTLNQNETVVNDAEDEIDVMMIDNTRNVLVTGYRSVFRTL